MYRIASILKCFQIIFFNSSTLRLQSTTFDKTFNLFLANYLMATDWQIGRKKFHNGAKIDFRDDFRKAVVLL